MSPPTDLPDGYSNDKGMMMFAAPDGAQYMLALKGLSSGGSGPGIRTQVYNNSTWAAEVAVNSDMFDPFSITSWSASKLNNDEFHVVAIDSGGRLDHYKRAGTGPFAWSTVQANITGLTSHTKMSLSTDGVRLWLFYDKGDNRIYYRRYSGASWGAEQTLKSTATALQGAITSAERAVGIGCQIPVAWVEGSVSPYNVVFDSITACDVIYYSVGTQTAALYSNNASAASGTLTLAVAAANNVGVGDEIRPNASSSRYYITGRQSPTVFAIQDSAANAGVPGSTSITFGSTSIEIYRAFNSISSAVTGSIDANHLGTSDLVGAGFQLNWPSYADGVMTNSATINGYTTGPLYYIRLYTPVYGSQVGASQRHSGVAGTGFRLAHVTSTPGDFYSTLQINDEYVRVEGIELDGSGITNGGVVHAIRVISGTPSDIRVDSCIIHDYTNSTLYDATHPWGNNSIFGIYVVTGAAKISNCFVYGITNLSTYAPSHAYGIDLDDSQAKFVYNNTVFDIKNPASTGQARGIQDVAGSVTARNNVVMDVVSTAGTEWCFLGSMTASNNVSSDSTADDQGPGIINQTNYATYLQNVNSGMENLHLRNTAFNLWGANEVDLSGDANLPVTNDVDRQGRIRPDHGADEYNGATAVTLRSFAASALDGAVELSWETAAELDNLGFHLYRASVENGPWTRITPSLIRGLGSSPEGKRYSWLDQGLTNGTTYFYRLEDIDRSRLATAHGPISATPAHGLGVAAAEPGTAGPSADPPPSSAAAGWHSYGEPSTGSLRVLKSTRSSLTLELTTGGFYARAEEDGTMRLYVPGFFDLIEPGLPQIPTRRAWVDVPAGSGVRIASIVASERAVFRGLVVGSSGAPQAITERGTYRVGFRRVKPRTPRGSLFPAALARILETAFQDETKKAYVELSPLRVGASGQVVLARKLVVRLVFQGRAVSERSRGGTRGRKEPEGVRDVPAPASRMLARLSTGLSGLHGVEFEGVIGSGDALSTASLRLSRLGQAVAFHVEPRADRFGPGSTLYFLAEGAEAAYGTETVYELAITSGGVQMPVAGASRIVTGATLPALVETRTFEQNTNYLPGLLNARDLWLWDYGLVAPNGSDYAFTLGAVRAGSGPGVLKVDLQGGSDAGVHDTIVREVDA